MNELEKILSDMHPEIDFSQSHDLVGEGILDSIDIVTLIGEIEERFGVRISIDELTPENFSSVGAIRKMIERLRG